MQLIYITQVRLNFYDNVSSHTSMIHAFSEMSWSHKLCHLLIYREEYWYQDNRLLKSESATWIQGEQGLNTYMLFTKKLYKTNGSISTWPHLWRVSLL